MRKKISLFTLMLFVSMLFIGWAEASSFVPEAKNTEALVKGDLPNVLQDWEKWTVEGANKSKCDFAYNNFDEKYCYYISNLGIEIDDKEASFMQKVKVLDSGYVLVPGSAEVFPTNVFVNGKETNIISRSGRPYIHLTAGTYDIEGKAKSKEEIRYLFIPNNATVVDVKNNGKKILNPTIDYQGILRLETQSATRGESDDISVFVYRKITDNIPVMMNVRLSLNVTGKERVENLGKIIPNNFSLLSIDSNISVYVQKNGDLIAEVKPGYANIDIALRQNNESLDFVLDNSPATQEIWVFESDKSRRVIQAPLSLRSVQTQNIPMPEQWKRLPAYEVNKDESFTLKAIEYENKNLDTLSLNRDIKLAFDGSFYSIQDNISADFKENGRLSIKSPFKFYSASIDGQPQSITYTSQNKDAGIEVRKGLVNIVNILRVDNKNSIPAAGYNREFNNVNWNLELAPGYKLFYASGVDSVSNSWVSNWNLMSVFIVALLVVCFYYLFGFTKAFVGLVLTVLIYPLFPQFATVSFVLCGLLFLQRNIKPEQEVGKIVSYVRYTLFFLLATVSFVFVVRHIREAIYPSLDTGRLSDFMDLLSTSFLITFYLASFIAYVGYRIISNKDYKVGKKVFYIFGMFFLLVIGTSLLGIIAGVGPRSPAPYGEYEYNDMSLKDMEVSEDIYDDTMQYSAKFEKVAGNMLMQNRASNVSQKMLNEVGMKRYQSINVARNIAQTGVGFPSWNEYSSSIRLFLKGPVINGDNFRLYLLTPCVNIILAFLRSILLIFALIWLFDAKKTGSGLGEKGKSIMKKLFIACILGLILLNPVSAKAESVIPSSEILNKMKEKLTREYAPSCLPECVSIPEGLVYNHSGDIFVKIKIHSNERLVVPLPVLRADGNGFVKLKDVVVNGSKTDDTLRKDDSIFVLLPKGINTVEVSYVLDDNADRFILSSKIKINYMKSGLEGFSFSENKAQNQTFQINRLKKTEVAKKDSEAVKQGTETAKMNIETFFIVKRNFDINTLWQVTTQVIRTNNLSEAATIEVPLLDGEKVINTDGALSLGKVRISFAPKETFKSFDSLLPVEQNIKLKTLDKVGNYKEEWEFNVDYTWSFKHLGVKAANSDANSIIFKPNAGEVLDFQIFRPSNVDGYVITFDKVDYNISYGRGVVEAKISLNLRASDAGVHDIIIPANAEIKELLVERRQYPITVNGNKLSIPVVQGNNYIEFTASIKNELGTLVKFPKFDLKAPAVNITEVAQVPLKRWVLFTSGPVKGPSVLFWSMIPAWLLFAFVLSRFKAAPLSFGQWFILLLGLTQANMMCMLIIIAWFGVMGIRDKFSDGLKFKKLFQIAIPLLTLLFVYCLFNGVYSGLLGNWSMRITGGGYNYGSFFELKWYQDATMGALPMPKIVSLPIWVYRCFMVLWSTWLAIYFVKWMRWGFNAYVKDSVWNNHK